MVPKTEVNASTEILEAILEEDIVKGLVPPHAVTSEKTQIIEKLKDFLEAPGEPQAFHTKAWLKTRVFESVIASVGLRQYLGSLVAFDRPNPERNVQVNSLFGSIHILTSLNTFTLELISLLRNWKRISMTNEQFEAVKSVLRPSKTFDVTWKETYFESYQIEDIRNQLLRYSLDILSKFEYEGFAYQQQLKKLEYELPDTIPGDLQYLSSSPEISFEALLALSKRYRDLRLAILDGYLVWKFRQAPAIFIKQDRIYYSPRMSLHGKPTTNQLAMKQVSIVTKALREMSSAISKIPLEETGKKETQ